LGEKKNCLLWWQVPIQYYRIFCIYPCCQLFNWLSFTPAFFLIEKNKLISCWSQDFPTKMQKIITIWLFCLLKNLCRSLVSGYLSCMFPDVSLSWIHKKITRDLANKIQTLMLVCTFLWKIENIICEYSRKYSPDWNLW
jgi:hypothetical protein